MPTTVRGDRGGNSIRSTFYDCQEIFSLTARDAPYISAHMDVSGVTPIQLRIPDALMLRIDKLRLSLMVPPNRSELIRHLLLVGLEVVEKDQKK